MMNPSPTKIVELFSFVEVTLTNMLQWLDTSRKLQLHQSNQNRRKSTRLKWLLRSPSRVRHKSMRLRQPHLDQRPKGKLRELLRVAQLRWRAITRCPKRRQGWRQRWRGKSEPRTEKRKQQCVHFYRGTCQRGDQCRYEHQVGEEGRPVPVGPEILQRLMKQ